MYSSGLEEGTGRDDDIVIEAVRLKGESATKTGIEWEDEHVLPILQGKAMDVEDRMSLILLAEKCWEVEKQEEEEEKLEHSHGKLREKVQAICSLNNLCTHREKTHISMGFCNGLITPG